MKLILEKDQDKGFMGGTSFILYARTELTDDELAMVKQYKVHKEQLLTKTISILGKKMDLIITIGSLIDGQKFKCKEIGEILAYEDEIKEACERFKNLIEVMKNFGGKEIIEY